MIIKKIKDALTQTTVKIHGVPHYHRVASNKFDTVETWVRKDGHGTILKTGNDKYVGRYEKWNDVTRQYETRITEPKDEIEEVVDLMDEDIKEGEYKRETYESDRKELIEDAGYKPEGKAVWVIREGEDFWRPWGLRDWTEEELEAFRNEFKAKGWKDVMLVENDGTDPNKTQVKDAEVRDDFGWEIPSGKAWEAYEAVLRELGAQKLLQEMEFAMGKDEYEEAMKDIATDWDIPDADADELIEDAGEDDVLDALMQWLSFDDIADYLAFICRMQDLHIPQLVDEEEIEVDLDDALWARPDNAAGTAGRLANKPPVKYNGYLIMARMDGKFDVYTGNTFSLIGTEYKTVEEAKKNIDEGRGQKAETKINNFEEDDEEIEVDEDVIDEDTPEIKVKGTDPKTAKNPNAKRVNYAGFNFTQNQDGTWTLKAGGIRAGKFRELLTGATFGEAVEWLFDNMDVKVPEGNTRDEQIILEYLPENKKRG